MIVLHVAETIKGGVATVLRELLSGQQPRFSRVVVLVPYEHLVELGRLDCEVKTFRRGRRNFLSLVRMSVALAMVVWRVKPDVVHLHSTFAGFAGRLILRALRPWRKSVVVYSPHGFSFLIDCAEWKRATFAAVERLLARLSHRIICVSNYEAAAASQRGLPAAKLSVVYNGVRDAYIPLEREKSDKTRLLFVGRLDRQKGFDVLIEAFRMLDPESFSLTVVGSAVNDLAVEAQNGLIEMVGWVPVDQMGKHFRRADLVVMPSRWEGFGLVAVEAQLHEVPVVAANNTSLPEVVVDGVTGFLFPTGDATALASTIRSASRAELRAIGRAGRAHVRTNFLADRMCHETAEVYEVRD
jgi:glycosyltransferase involved in cell wall biosynthesis